MIKVIKINWLSKEALEAEVTLTDGKFELICFSQPFNYDLNDFIKTYVYCYETNNVLIEDVREFEVNKLNSTFAYKLAGELINKEECVVAIGDIRIIIEKDKLPGDVKVGDYISFNCKRIDIY